LGRQCQRLRKPDKAAPYDDDILFHARRYAFCDAPMPCDFYP
jgi:hypothetical protein